MNKTKVLLMIQLLGLMFVGLSFGILALQNALYPSGNNDVVVVPFVLGALFVLLPGFDNDNLSQSLVINAVLVVGTSIGYFFLEMPCLLKPFAIVGFIAGTICAIIKIIRLAYDFN